MRIDRFSSTQYRNLNHESIAFSPRVNLLVGQNGHGKTNVLEALQFFKLGRSFRTQRDSELVCFGEPFCRIEVSVESARGDRDELSASIERSGTKRIKYNGEDVAKYSDMIGRYPCVMFGPQDLALVAGFPAERRKFVDIVGSVSDRAYLEELRGYRRVLRQRNAALKAGRSREAHSVWTEELIARGCALSARRLAVVDAVRHSMQPYVDALHIPFAVDVQYDSELTAGRPDEVSCEEQFAARLAAVELEEMRRGVTAVGPHRDDVKLLANGRDLRRYGSQGQRRLLAILLRLAELSHLEQQLDEPCVLMLDDLFSELDETVAESLKRLLTNDRQIFVTSPVSIEWGPAETTRTFEISKGRITEHGGG